MSRRISRREFVASSAAMGAGALLRGPLILTNGSPNEKLNIASIGVGGKGDSDSADAARENLVAICDVDDKTLDKAGVKYPNAKKFNDYRKMLEEMGKSIDAVTVSTPDHMHAPAAIMAMKLGKHAFVQKPMGHSVYAVRLMKETAAKYKVATQMGNQGTAGGKLRTGVEVVRSGALGTVKEVHLWTNRPIWPQDIARPPETPPVPAHLHWDEWLGPAPVRPYHSAYHPFKWRGWWDFGTGAIGDMACHTANLPYFALKLTTPISAEGHSSPVNPETAPSWAKVILEFPARESLPPVTVTWYEGRQKGELVLPPKELFMGEKISGSGSLIIGDKGTMYSSDDYGDRWMLLPKDKFEGYKPPEPTLPRSPGHFAEWVRACKGGEPAMSNFNHASPFTESFLLGNVAIRVGKKFKWNSEKLTADAPEAAQYVKPAMRKGWEI